MADPRALVRRLRPAAAGLVDIDAANDVCQIALVERHRGTG